MIYQSSPVIKKLDRPVLSYKDIPYKAALIFNAGVAKFGGKYVMVFRNDYGSMEEHKLEGTNIGLAFSDDGINWKVEPKPCFSMRDSEILRAYDPRLTVIDGRCYMCFAVDTRHGLRGRSIFIKHLTKARYVYTVNGVEYSIRNEHFGTKRQTPRFIPVVYIKRFPRFAYIDEIGGFGDIIYGLWGIVLLFWGVALSVGIIEFLLKM